MILLSEIEVLATKIFGKQFISIWQVNRSTIRIELIEDSFIDTFQSLRDSTKFAIHAKLKNNSIYRLDCRPERKYLRLETFPWHFHNGEEDKVITSPFSINKKVAFSQFLKFIKKLKEK